MNEQTKRMSEREVEAAIADHLKAVQELVFDYCGSYYLAVWMDKYGNIRFNNSFYKDDDKWIFWSSMSEHD